MRNQLPAQQAADGPIRVLAILDDTVVSGKVKPVLTLARYARKDATALRPLEISMLTFSRSKLEPEMVTELRAEGFAIDVVRERRRFDFGVFPQLRSIIDRRQPHVLWTHGAKTHFLVRSGRLQRGKAWIAFHHGYTATSLTWRLYDQLDRWSLLGADKVMTACDAFAADLHTRLRIRPDRLSVHRSPIVVRASPKNDARAAALPEELGLLPDARIVLSVGRLSKEKGQDDLVRALAHARRISDLNIVLVLVGDGPETERLEQLCARLGVADAVRMVGYRSDVTAYYDAADVFALTSHSEGSPNVLLEAMDAGVPIVATAVGGIGEMIGHEKEGLLVPDRDTEGIARSIVALLGNAELRRALAVNARQSLPAYSPQSYYTGVHALFEKVV